MVLSLGGAVTGTGGGAGEGDPGKVIESLPDGFTASELGGYQLGPAVSATAGGGGMGGSGGSTSVNGNCGNIVLGVVRDFRGADEPNGHPDFEADIEGSGVTPELVAGMLGADRKPAYASKCEIGAPDLMACPYDAQTTSAANFGAWFANVPEVNMPYLISIFLEPQPNGLFSFESLHYFPVDGAGFDGQGLEYTGELHNFGFTTELHTQFRYRGGEQFTFQGDDDVWVFINERLAVDLGGLHSMQSSTIDLDQQAAALGLSVGMVYPLDLFHAERHTDASTFRIDTNLTFVDCGTIVPDPVK
jgi:fibro-slime domain-containing protein